MKAHQFNVLQTFHVNELNLSTNCQASIEFDSITKNYLRNWKVEVSYKCNIQCVLFSDDFTINNSLSPNKNNKYEYTHFKHSKDSFNHFLYVSYSNFFSIPQTMDLNDEIKTFYSVC